MFLRPDVLFPLEEEAQMSASFSRPSPADVGVQISGCISYSCRTLWESPTLSHKDAVPLAVPGIISHNHWPQASGLAKSRQLCIGLHWWQLLQEMLVMMTTLSAFPSLSLSGWVLIWGRREVFRSLRTALFTPSPCQNIQLIDWY